MTITELRGRCRFVIHRTACLALLSAAPLFAADSRPAPTGPVIVPSEETTLVTSPVDTEGYVDFLAAANERLGKGVARDENAAVLIIEALGLCDNNLDVTNNLREALGLPAWSSGSLDFISLGEYVREQTDEFDDDSPERQTVTDRLKKQNGAAMQRPWVAADFPDMAALLKRNVEPLKLIRQGAQRPKYYRPLVRRQPTDTLVEILLPDVQSARDVARQLTMRAMLHLGEGRPAEAQADLLTLHRLARHIGHGATLIEGLVGIAIDSIACNADNRWATHPSVTPAMIAAHRAQLSALPTIMDVVRSLNVCERYMGLDMIQALARGRITAGSTFNMAAGIPDEGVKSAWMQPDRFLDALVGLTVDWNVMMKEMNRQYDDMIQAASVADPIARDVVLDAWDERIKARRVKSTSTQAIVATVLGSSKTRGQNLASLLGTMLMPAVRQVFEADRRSTMRQAATVTGLAVLEYRVQQGQLPGSLAALVPQYLPAVPTDSYTGQPLKYLVDGATFRVYSVGPNRQDDGGRTFTDKQKWDDLRFAAPVPDDE